MQLYTGYKNDMCFIRPNNADGIKRVNEWSDPNIPPTVTDNLPLKGYQILGINVLNRSNYGTSYKRNTYTIQSPSGFKFWISPDNLSELILKCKINNGLIENELMFNKTATRLILAGETPIPNLKSAEIVAGSAYATSTAKTAKVFYYYGKYHLKNLSTNEVKPYYAYYDMSCTNPVIFFTSRPKKLTHKAVFPSDLLSRISTYILNPQIIFYVDNDYYQKDKLMFSDYQYTNNTRALGNKTRYEKFDIVYFKEHNSYAYLSAKNVFTLFDFVNDNGNLTVVDNGATITSSSYYPVVAKLYFGKHNSCQLRTIDITNIGFLKNVK